MIVPVAIAVAQAADVSPIAARARRHARREHGLHDAHLHARRTPSSTAPGYVPITAMMRYGIALDIVGFVVIVAVVTLAGPMLF